MLKVLAGCFLVFVGLVLWVAWFLSSVGRPEKGPPKGLAAPLGPDEVKQHRPRTEQDLRALALGPNTERIVELYRRGRLARGAFFELAMEETPLGRHSKSLRFYRRYGWYDASGRLQERQSDDPASGLLNAAFDPVRRDITFVVAYDPGSKDHVIFYEDGGLRLAAPPAPSVNVPQPPAGPDRAAPDLSRLEPLLRSAPAQFDDLEALYVLADRLVELGSPRGEFMALQLARAADQPPSAREQELLEDHSAAWRPPGADPTRTRFERGFPVETALSLETDPSHPGWQTMRVLEVHPLVSPETLLAGPDPLPRLRELYGVDPSWLHRALPLVAARLEVLHVAALHLPETVEAVLDSVSRLEHLHTLELEGARVRPTTELLGAVFRRPFPALARLWLPEPLDGLPPLRALVEGAPRRLTVCLSIDFDGYGPRRKSRTWVELERGAVRIHQRGAPNRGSLTRARELLASVGVDDSRVFS